MGKVIQTVADSIAIEILDGSTILTGKGNELHLYGKNDFEDVFEAHVLSIKLRNKIHGIKKTHNLCEKLVLVYGEKEFVLLEYNGNLKFNEIYRAELSDWISCGLFLNEYKEFVLITAHSVVLRFSYNVADRKCCLKERVSCIDKSTLYCAQLFGNNWKELVAFGGNAFGELLIWQPSEHEGNKTEPLKPLLSSLLQRIPAHNGVIFSIEYDQDSQFLVTTSDDRAIKCWKVEFITRFNWSNATVQALSSGYGHLARVFQGRIIKDGSIIYALSGGEDSYFCLWNTNGELLFKRRQQYGAIIWNFLYDNITKTIYTVGSTGNLVAFGLNQVLEEIQTNHEAILLPTLSDESSIEYIAKVAFLHENCLIGVTNHHNLVISRYEREEWLNWKPIMVKLGFKCTAIAVYQNVVAICGYKRLILFECPENDEAFSILYDGEVLAGVIRIFIFFNKQKYLICDDRGNCLIHLNSADNKRYLEMPKAKEPWLTAALLLNQEQHIVLSNRQGNLLLFQLYQGTKNYELKYVLKYPHGNLGATDLESLEEKSTSALIRSAGHDGALNVFSVDFCNNTIRTCSRQVIPVAWVECIEKCRNDLWIFLGFNDNHFAVWCQDYEFLLQIPCGGGHRCWSHVIDPKNETISVVFIQNKRVRFHKLPLLNKELTKLPLAKRWHVAACNSVQILTQPSSAHQIAVSAGDDNLLKIHTFNARIGLKEHKELQHHISNIRCLKVFSINENEFLIISGGGRAQLCVTKVNSSNFHVNEMINSTIKQENYNQSNRKPFNFEPETRLMSLDVKILNEDEYEIFVGCSNGFIKRIKLNLNTLELILLTQYFYNKCILQIRYVMEVDLVLVAATDGVINIFNSTLSKCLHQLQHHSSGINGLSLLYNTSNTSLHVLSGGDDQAVSYTEISINDLDFKVLRQFCQPFLHTSQVCACALSSNGKYGFTSGVDQVLNKIDLTTGEVVDSFYSCVADIKGVALIDDNVCLLYGCGLQIYAFDS